MRAPSESFDTYQFERLVGEASDLLDEGRPNPAAGLLKDALALWRGPPLAEFRYEDFAQAEITRLDEVRLTAVERRIDANLAMGRHRHVVAELEALVADHPLRERFRLQLMLALYRCGRQADALDAYRAARQTLRDELGVEPTPELRRLELAILQHDPALEAPRLSVTGHLRRRPRFIAVVAIAFAVAATLGVVVALRGRTVSPPVKVVANSVAVIDPATGRVVDDIHVGDYPGQLAAGKGSVWIGTAGDNTLTRIDATTRKPSFPNGVQQTLDLAVTSDALWIANGTNDETNPPTGGGTVERVTLRNGATKMIRVGPPKTLSEWWTVVASDGDRVWADNGSSQVLVRIDRVSGEIVQRVPGVGGGGRIAVGAGAVWVAEYTRNSVARVDARTGVVNRIPVTSRPTTIAVGEGSVWVTTQKPHSAVWRIDPRTVETTAVIPVAPTARSVATGAGAVWVTSGTYAGQPGVPAGPGQVTKIDPRSGQIERTTVVGFRPDGVTVYNGLVWVAVAPRR